LLYFPQMQFSFLQFQPAHDRVAHIFEDWREDSVTFLRHDAPKILWALVVAFILLMLFRIMRNKLIVQSHRQDLPTGLRAQQLRTLASVIYSIGVFVVIFYAATTILPILGLNIGPLLASAGVAGFAIGFGAQTLVKDVINGFFILVENMFDVGDTIRTAGVQGTVESITLRKTILRDADGTVHTVPNSQMTIVSNLTRDWTQLALHIAADYKENSDKVISVLKEVAHEVYSDEKFNDFIVAEPEVPGIDKVTGDQVEYLLLVKTRPGKQFAVSRELRRRIKECFERNDIKPGSPNRVYVVGDSTRPSTPA
jgi:moderate conductance mechanosensitive channel